LENPDLNAYKIWFEEELLPSEANVSEMFKSTKLTEFQADPEKVKTTARGIVRMQEPVWGTLNDTEYKFLQSGEVSRYYLVRLTCEFDIPKQARDQGTFFRFARCQSYLSSDTGDQPYPRVYDVFPRDLYEGEQQKIGVRLNPTIKLEPIELSIGDIGADFAVGVIEPIVVGFLGEDAREPSWEIEPQGKPLLGIRNFWLVITVPQGCNGIYLAAKVEGELQTRWGAIYVGPREHTWDKRHKILIV
jgi:hypothetical protein